MPERTCRDVAELLSAYRDGETTPEERSTVEAHLRQCPSCSATLAYYSDLHDAVRGYLVAIPISPSQANHAVYKPQKGIETMAARTLTRSFPQPSRWPVTLLAVAATIAIAFVVVFYAEGQPHSVNAQEILAKAAQVAGDPAATGIQSLEMITTYWSKRLDPRFGSVGAEMRSESHLWWQAPNRWRQEFRQTAPLEQAMLEPNISVSDGRSMWQSTAAGQEVTINAWEPQMDILKELSHVESAEGGEAGEAPVDLALLLQNARQCYDPRLLPAETVAGRAAYVVDLGPTKCPSASVGSMNGRRVIWVDQETSFELKSQQYGGQSGQELVASSEVTSIRLDEDIYPQVFTFVPRPDAKVHDFRPQPAPSVEQFRNQLEQLAKEVDFPVFVPRSLPTGLEPRQPRLDPTSGLRLEYVPAAEVEKNSFAARAGMEITEQRATYDLVQRWTEMAQTIDLGATKAWSRRGFRNVDGTGSDSAVLVLRGGTLVSLNSFTFQSEELIIVASSLEPAPGSKPALPNPVPPALGEVQAKASFLVLLPAYLPPNLQAEPPSAGPRQGADRFDSLSMRFHTPDGAIALRLAEHAAAEQNTLPAQVKSAPEVTISGARTGHLYETAAPMPSGTRLLWWEQSGTYIALETQKLDKDELLRIAASMSETAKIEQTELPAGRPTPAPASAPKFTILRPALLPEKAVAREQLNPGPPEFGSSVTLGYDPRPEDRQRHSVLILKEMPKAQLGNPGPPHPQETVETIGGRQVRIISRAGACITLLWEVGDVALTLSNPYDPPGHPRYSCEDLRKVVESTE